MQKMQAVIGYGVLAIVFIIAVVGSLGMAANVKGNAKKFLVSVLSFAGLILGCYGVLLIFGGLFWILAWVGIFLRQILQWLIEGVFYPFHWLIP